MALTLKKARTIVRATLARAREAGFKPMCVVVLDPGGHVVAVEREDGASAGRFDIARGKAHGCLMLGLGGSAIQARAEAQGYFMQAMNGLFDGRMVPVQGGVLIRDGRGTLLGAVGVTGDTSDNDRLAAEAGVTAAGYTPVG
jgi:uncharacterized protein GlcG (DUF336 family)